LEVHTHSQQQHHHHHHHHQLNADHIQHIEMDIVAVQHIPGSVCGVQITHTTLKSQPAMIVDRNCGVDLSQGDRHSSKMTQAFIRKKATFDDLPLEIQVKILSLLNLKELLQVSLVCNQWNKLAFDGSLWQTLELKR
jgi:hypothetical protein